MKKKHIKNGFLKKRLYSLDYSTVFENHRKSLVHCERSELRLDFEMTKIPFKIGQKLVENVKMRHFQ